MLPAGLSMLWEPVDPTQAVRQRFGFDGFASAADWVAETLDAAWGLSVVGCPRMVISGLNAICWTDTGQGSVIVKWSADQGRFPALDASARLLRHLARTGLPIAAPIAAATGEDRVIVAGPTGPLSIVVQPELAGTWLDVDDPDAVHAAGVCLAHVHRELSAYTDARFPTKPRIEVSRAAVQRWLDTEDRGFAPQASARLRELVAELPDLDTKPQLTHGDVRAANLLTDGSSVVGLLDFDEVSVGQPLGDLAHASVYLSTRFTDWRPTSPKVRAQFRTGYESVRSLTRAEGQWCEAMTLLLGLQAIPGEIDPGGWAAALATPAGLPSRY